jgi:MFS transporter, SP family, general alpha glucoside:H+ symporter
MAVEKGEHLEHQTSNVEEQLAHLTNQEDHESGKWQAIKKNPRAFLWCLYSVWTILLVSFENQAAGTVIGIPQFRKDFGSEFEGSYVLSTKWQAAFSGAPVASYVGFLRHISTCLVVVARY